MWPDFLFQLILSSVPAFAFVLGAVLIYFASFLRNETDKEPLPFIFIPAVLCEEKRDIQVYV